MDYKKFLSQSEDLVLPYFGGTRVDAQQRHFKVEQTDHLTPGWWRFKIDGRRATPVERASSIDLGSLPLVRGHWAAGWVVVDGRQLGRIPLAPDDEPAALSRVTARRWYSQDLLFDTTEFEDDAELEARRALEERRALGAVKGVAPSLRAAFGYLLGLDVARMEHVDVSLRELTPRVAAIADGGPDVARQLFAGLVAERARQAEEASRRVREAELRARDAAAAARYGAAVASAQARQRARDPVRRADEALDGAGARMLSCRRIAQNTQLDVTYEVDGERILSIVDIETLQVIDPGVCLAGEHGVLTLDAMPSVIREAIEEDHLNITRH
jgi:hypothetical protein